MRAIEQQFGELFKTPEWFSSNLDVSDGTVHFCRMSEETYTASTWLDERKTTIDGMYHKLHLSQVSQFASNANVSMPCINYIFHTSHCGSTLLARCLDELSDSFVLKEPLLYRLLSIMRRDNRIRLMVQNGQWEMLLDICLKLLGRTYQPEQVATIKATSICHNIMSECMTQHDASKGLFLFNGLEDFMASIYKDRERVDVYLEHYYPMLLHDLLIDDVIDQDEASKLAEPQKIAAMWLARILAFKKSQAELPKNKIMSLEFKRLIEAPEESIQLVASHFSYTATEEDINRICTTGPMVKYSKQSSENWNSDKAKTKRESILNQFDKEISEGMEWVEKVSPTLLQAEMPNRI